MASIASSGAAGKLGVPLYERKVIANPAQSSDSAANKSSANQAANQAATTQNNTISAGHAAAQGRVQALTQQLDDKLTSSLSSIRQKIGGSSPTTGHVLDVHA